jgi:hypothetical protein
VRKGAPHFRLGVICICTHKPYMDSQNPKLCNDICLPSLTSENADSSLKKTPRKLLSLSIHLSISTANSNQHGRFSGYSACTICILYASSNDGREFSAQFSKVFEVLGRMMDIILQSALRSLTNSVKCVSIYRRLPPTFLCKILLPSSTL